MSIRVADYIVDRLYRAGAEQAFLITGGMIMHLTDALLRHGKQKFFCCHHEQAAAMAAEAYGRYVGTLGVAYVTAGPNCFPKSHAGLLILYIRKEHRVFFLINRPVFPGRFLQFHEWCHYLMRSSPEKCRGRLILELKKELLLQLEKVDRKTIY